LPQYRASTPPVALAFVYILPVGRTASFFSLRQDGRLTAEMKASAIIYGNLASLQYSRDWRHTKYQKIQFLRICGLYYSTALAWSNPPISDGGATQLRQFDDIRSNPPRLVNDGPAT